MATTVKFVSVPSKTLSASINASATTIQLSDIKGWDGNNLAAANFGDVLWAVLRNSTNTQMEIMKLDPTTIANASISILARGLDFSGGFAEVTINKLTWIKNDTIVELGSNPPQLLNQTVCISGNQTIADLKTFSTLPQCTAVPSVPGDLVNKAYADALALAGVPNASTTVQGAVQEATQAQIDAKTITGSTGAKLFVPLDKRRSTLLSDYKVDTGAANAYVITPAPAITAYTTGQVFSFKAVAANTGASTLNVNGLGAIAIKKFSSVALDASDILAGQLIIVEYDGTNFQMLNPPGTNSGSGNFGDGSDGAVTISVDTTLSRDMYYTTLTVNAGINLSTGGYRIFVSGTLTLNGTIRNNGGNGGIGSNGLAPGGTPSGGGGGTAGTAATGSLVGTAGLAGGSGGHGALSGGTYSNGGGGGGGSGAPGGIVAIYAKNIVIGVAGVIQANGGTGGNGGAGSGVGTGSGSGAVAGSGGTTGSNGSTKAGLTSSAVNGAAGGAGGTNGGGAGGGAGGAGTGGTITTNTLPRTPVVAVTLIDLATVAAIVSAPAPGSGGGGGGGGLTGSANSTAGGGGGGGGGGGNGGAVILVYSSLSNSGTITTSGGAGGTFGTATACTAGTGSNGNTGTTGAAGVTYSIKI